jgi:PAS domain S-box-containing protein
LFRNAPLPVLLHVDARIVDANPAAARLLGQASVESMRGVSVLDLYADDADRELARNRLRQLATQPLGTRLPLAELKLRTDGRAAIVSATAVRVDLQGESAVLSMFVDVTERHQAEEALRRSEATLSHLVDTSPDVISLTDLETGRYEMVNRAFEQMSGWSQAEAVGRTSLELGIWGSASGRERFVQQFQRDGKVVDLPIPFRCRDGRIVTLMISAARFRLDGRDMLVINGRDISARERERMERAAILDNAGIGVAVTRDSHFVLVNAEFERMKTELISDQEFKKLRNQIENDFVSRNSNVAGIAESLANYHMYFGDANLINTEIERYLKVTKEDVMNAAKKYYTSNNGVVLYFLNDPNMSK